MELKAERYKWQWWGKVWIMQILTETDYDDDGN